MPRFVVLYHELPAGHDQASHWDLMLEHDAVLRTWALAEPPASISRQTARALADHRPAYLDYEGPVAGDRGRVTRWDEGEYATVDSTPDAWLVAFRGARLQSQAMFIRGETPGSWMIEWR